MLGGSLTPTRRTSRHLSWPAGPRDGWFGGAVRILCSVLGGTEPTCFRRAGDDVGSVVEVDSLLILSLYWSRRNDNGQRAQLKYAFEDHEARSAPG